MPDITTYTGAYGFDLVIDTNLDLTGAETIKLRIKSPSGTTVVRNLAAENVDEPASAGIVRYTVTSNDFTVPGNFKLQVSDETGGAKKVTSSIYKVKVQPSVEYVGS